MRSIGLTPTDKEAEELGASVADANGNIAWDAFQHLVRFLLFFNTLIYHIKKWKVLLVSVC